MHCRKFVFAAAIAVMSPLLLTAPAAAQVTWMMKQPTEKPEWVLLTQVPVAPVGGWKEAVAQASPTPPYPAPSAEGEKVVPAPAAEETPKAPEVEATAPTPEPPKVSDKQPVKKQILLKPGKPGEYANKSERYATYRLHCGKDEIGMTPSLEDEAAVKADTMSLEQFKLHISSCPKAVLDRAETKRAQAAEQARQARASQSPTGTPGEVRLPLCPHGMLFAPEKFKCVPVSQ